VSHLQEANRKESSSWKKWVKQFKDRMIARVEVSDQRTRAITEELKKFAE
jgi:hypothetical protein